MNIGVHPDAEWLSVSPNGRWLYSGFYWESVAQSEKATPMRRYDLRAGAWRTAKGNDSPEWLSNGQLVLPVGSDKEDLQSEIFGGERAPVIGLFWPASTRATVVLRDKLVARDSYIDCVLGADKRTATLLSTQFVRRFDVRTGRLKTRLANPISKEKAAQSQYGSGTLSPDGRFLLSLHIINLYNAQNGKLRRTFPGRSEVVDKAWISPTIFMLRRGTQDGNSRSYTEFWDAVTLKRLWVLSDYPTRERLTDNTSGAPVFYYQNFWRSYPLIAQPNAIIVCGQNSWTWRDAHSGRVLREAIRPQAWTLMQTEGRGIEVLGDDYFYIDKKGSIWRDKFRFTSRKK